MSDWRMFCFDLDNLTRAHSAHTNMKVRTLTPHPTTTTTTPNQQEVSYFYNQLGMPADYFRLFDVDAVALHIQNLLVSDPFFLLKRCVAIAIELSVIHFKRLLLLLLCSSILVVLGDVDDRQTEKASECNRTERLTFSPLLLL